MIKFSLEALYDTYGLLKRYSDYINSYRQILPNQELLTSHATKTSTDNEKSDFVQLLLKEMPILQWWRLLLDLNRQKSDDFFKEEDLKKILLFDHQYEPGFMVSMLYALFDTLGKIDEPVTVDFLCNLSKLSAPAKFNEPGSIRPKNFDVTYGVKCSSEGSKEMLNHLKIHQNDFEFINLHNAFLRGMRNPFYSFSNRLEDRVKELLVEYESQVKKYKSLPNFKEKILTHLISLIQDLIRIHPFRDGNSRVLCCLLFIKEQLRHELPLTLLSCPNFFAGLSLEEMKNDIIQGRDRLKKVREKELENNSRLKLSIINNGIDNYIVEDIEITFSYFENIIALFLYEDAVSKLCLDSPIRKKLQEIINSQFEILNQQIDGNIILGLLKSILTYYMIKDSNLSIKICNYIVEIAFKKDLFIDEDNLYTIITRVYSQSGFGENYRTKLFALCKDRFKSIYLFLENIYELSKDEREYIYGNLRHEFIENIIDVVKKCLDPFENTDIYKVRFLSEMVKVDLEDKINNDNNFFVKLKEGLNPTEFKELLSSINREIIRDCLLRNTNSFDEYKVELNNLDFDDNDILNIGDEFTYEILKDKQNHVISSSLVNKRKLKN